MARPNAALDALSVPKDGTTHLTPPAAVAEPKKYAHTLSLRLNADQYRRLRRFVAAQEEASGGGRLTHQAVIEAALADYLDRHGG